ncbi:hypothetical protein A4X09_0g3537 [Tilletia walkeri]|uniref:Mesaconyl-C4 CoA hydratase n=1 Tax=Tilletia walkeri TaxID=117179 RepID=A0A8X7NB57_9BASI|nr:hypothetical protein A4X09_0g3537 [Tilletia walkeri]
MPLHPIRRMATRSAISSIPNLKNLSHQFSTTSKTLAPTPVPEWASPQARSAAEGLLTRWHAYDDGPSPRPASDYVQTLDANQLGLLRVLVEPMVPIPGVDGHAADVWKERGQEQLLSAEHLAYFTPRIPTSQLGPDGSDPSFNPPGNLFTRRMWAGGQMTFLQPEKMKVGAEVRERTFIEDVLVKKFGKGVEKDEMLVVWLRKEYEVAGEVVLLDRRSWVFRKALNTLPSASPLPPPTQQDETPASPSSASTYFLRQKPADLFRFSALTYNAHQIHLDSHWARTIEGHPDIVVHGPLNLLLLSRFWLALEAVSNQGRKMTGITYRATSPLYANEAYKLVHISTDVVEEGTQKRWRDVVQAVRADSEKVIMEATVESTA